MTSSSLSVFSSTRSDEELTGSGCESSAAPPVHMEISGNLSDLLDTTVGAVIVASGDAGGGSSSIAAGLAPERFSGVTVAGDGEGLAGIAGEGGVGKGTKRRVADSGASRSGHLFCWDASTEAGLSASPVAGVERATGGDREGEEGFDEPILPSTGAGSVRRASGSGSSAG